MYVRCPISQSVGHRVILLHSKLVIENMLEMNTHINSALYLSEANHFYCSDLSLSSITNPDPLYNHRLFYNSHCHLLYLIFIYLYQNAMQCLLQLNMFYDFYIIII